MRRRRSYTPGRRRPRQDRVQRDGHTPGEPIRITKFVAYHTSRGVPAEELADRCTRTLDRALDDGFDALLAEQRAWLDGFWARSDIELRGRRRRSQQAIRWNLFQLAQAVGRADGARHRRPRASPAAATTATTSGTPRSTSCRSSPTPTRRPPATCCASATALLDAARAAGARDEPARRAVPVAHDQRRGGVGLLRRPAPRSTTSTPTSPTRSSRYVDGHRRRRVPAPTRAPRCSSRPPGCGPTSGSTTSDDTGVPHPRGDRARRVHRPSSTTTSTRT